MERDGKVETALAISAGTLITSGALTLHSLIIEIASHGRDHYSISQYGEIAVILALSGISALASMFFEDKALNQASSRMQNTTGDLRISNIGKEKKNLIYKIQSRKTFASGV